jgi:hypothetical protein
MDRYIILLCMTALFATTAFSFSSKKDKTPQAVEESFKKKFPDAQKIKWEKENTEYEASFVVNGIKTSANFTLDGKWMETESTVAISNLPKVVSDGILTAYPGAKIIDAAKIETPEKGIQYEADIKDGKKKMEVLFNAEGKEVKK